jgi:enterochelin esterase-like enzyme
MQMVSRVFAAVLWVTAASLHAQTASPIKHTFVRVTIDQGISAPVSGRLLLFAKQGSGDKAVDISESHPRDAVVAAMEVHSISPGTTIEMDADQEAFPRAFSALPAGGYELQAVLDVDHSYNYGGRSANDWQSDVIEVKDWPSNSDAEPVLTLSHHPEASLRAKAAQGALAQARPGVAEKAELQSALLTRFWGRPMFVRAWVILPPAYDNKAATTYPTVYWTHGFGGNLPSALVNGLRLRKLMEDGKIPPMIYVMLDESVAQGTHEFADSANNGPWGAALTSEFIPWLEGRYRMDAKPTGRFLNGHSSGGWATLQLQINYPRIFGGTWSTSPDPSDFHNFTGPDLYSPHANVYRKPDGTAYPIMHDNGQVLATLEQFSKLEAVLGPYGGQMSSFDWVFSPKGPSGAPEPMFDRVTGDVDPAVVGYWHDHYDLAHLVESKWPKDGPLLKGRIHLIVGTADTFYLDESARLFEARLQRLGAEPHFTYIPGRNHFDLYKVGDDSLGLFYQMAAEMYGIARPNSKWRRAQ